MLYLKLTDEDTFLWKVANAEKILQNLNQRPSNYPIPVYLGSIGSNITAARITTFPCKVQNRYIDSSCVLWGEEIIQYSSFAYVSRKPRRWAL